MTTQAIDPAAHEAQQRADSGRDELVLGSELAAMAPLTAWVDKLAERHGFSRKVAFAARLCLEEAISNAIRHGYHEQAGSEVRVRFSGGEAGHAVFTVDDDAPPFDPLAQAERPAIGPDAVELGGQGIRLMRAFAASLRYEATATGNRLRIEFAAPPQETSASPHGTAPL